MLPLVGVDRTLVDIGFRDDFEAFLGLEDVLRTVVMDPRSVGKRWSGLIRDSQRSRI